MVGGHQQLVSLAQCDDVWFDALDDVAKAAADQMIFRKKWLKSNFWLLAHSIIGSSVDKSESPVTPYMMYPERTGEDLLAAPSPVKTSRSCSLERPDFKKQRLGQSHDDGFTAMSEPSTTVRLRHKVRGKVIMVGRAYYIQFNGESLAKFTFVLCAEDGSVKETVLDNDVQRFGWRFGLTVEVWIGYPGEGKFHAGCSASQVRPVTSTCSLGHKHCEFTVEHTVLWLS